jgi:hypothetical protein
VAGHLYVLGGIGGDFADAPEFWRVPLTKQARTGLLADFACAQMP